MNELKNNLSITDFTFGPQENIVHNITKEPINIYDKFKSKSDIILVFEWYFPEANTPVCTEELLNILLTVVNTHHVEHWIITMDDTKKVHQWVEELGSFDKVDLYFEGHAHSTKKFTNGVPRTQDGKYERFLQVKAIKKGELEGEIIYKMFVRPEIKRPIKSIVEIVVSLFDHLPD